MMVLLMTETHIVSAGGPHYVLTLLLCAFGQPGILQVKYGVFMGQSYDHTTGAATPQTLNHTLD